MPYAPGIQDISGQLIAQGMSQAGAARARAIESLGESISGGIKQYQQNQLFTNQSLAKFGMGLQDPTFKQYVDQVVNDDPNAPQVPEALKKAFKNAAKGKPDIYDAALLGSAAEGYQQNRLRQAQIQDIESQKKLREAQALGQTQDVLKSRFDMARTILSLREAGIPEEQIKNALQFMEQKVVAGGAAPAAGPSAAIAPAAPNAETRAAIAALPPELLQSISVSGQQPPVKAIQAVMGAASPMQGVGVAPVIPPAPQGGIIPPSGVSMAPGISQFLGATTAPTADAARASAGLQAATGAVFPSDVEAIAKAKSRQDALAGKPSNWIANARDLMMERRRQEAEAREYTLDEGDKAMEAFNLAEKDKPLGIRRQAEVVPTNRPGFVSLKIAVAPPTEKEKSELDIATTESKKLGEAALTENEADIAAGKEASKRLAESDVLLSALDNPNMYTGFGAEAVQNAKRLFGSLGANAKGIEDEAVFNTLIGNRIFSQAKNLRPASDTDLQLLISYNASKFKNREANKAILAFQRRGDQYEVEKRLLISDLRAKDIPEKQIRALKYAWEKSNPLVLLPEEQAAIRNAVEQGKTVEPKSTEGLKKKRGVYEAAGEALSPIGSFFQSITGKKPEDVLDAKQD